MKRKLMIGALVVFGLFAAAVVASIVYTKVVIMPFLRDSGECLAQTPKDPQKALSACTRLLDGRLAAKDQARAFALVARSAHVFEIRHDAAAALTDLDEAKGIFKAVEANPKTKLDPTVGRTVAWKRWALLTSLSRHDEALKEVREALEAYGSDPVSDSLAMCSPWFKGDLGAPFKFFQTRLTVEDPATRARLAGLALIAGDDAAALAAVPADRPRPDAWEAARRALALLDLGRQPEALKEADSAVAAEPDGPRRAALLAMRGTLRRLTGNKRAAEDFAAVQGLPASEEIRRYAAAEAERLPKKTRKPSRAKPAPIDAAPLDVGPLRRAILADDAAFVENYCKDSITKSLAPIPSPAQAKARGVR